MKVFSEESALQLSEMLLQNDKDIKTEIEGKIPSVEGLASEKYVDNAVKNVEVDLTGYATETYVDNAIANAQLSGGDTNVDLSGYATKDDLNDYAAKEHTHDEYLTEHQDLSDYAKRSEIPTDYLSSIPDEYVTEEEMTEAINNAKLGGETVDLSDYATKEYVNDAVENVNVDLTGYATETFVTDKIAEIDIPNLDDYAKMDDIPDTSNFVEKEEGKGLFSGSYNDLNDKPVIPSVDGLVSEDTLNATLKNYAKSTDIPTDYLTTVPEEYVTETEMSNAISGIQSMSVSYDAINKSIIFN